MNTIWHRTNHSLFSTKKCIICRVVYRSIIRNQFPVAFRSVNIPVEWNWILFVIPYLEFHQYIPFCYVQFTGFSILFCFIPDTGISVPTHFVPATGILVPFPSILITRILVPSLSFPSSNWNLYSVHWVPFQSLSHFRKPRNPDLLYPEYPYFESGHTQKHRILVIVNLLQPKTWVLFLRLDSIY